MFSSGACRSSVATLDIVKLLLERSFKADSDVNRQWIDFSDHGDSDVGTEADYLKPIERILPQRGIDCNDDISSFSSFISCLNGNRPCVFPAEFTSSWRCRNEWVDAEVDGPSWSFLSRTFGEADVTVANCKAKHFNSHLTSDKKFTDYLDYWQEVVANNYDYDTFDNLYLKDWHFMRKFSDYVAYETPFCFKNDWLNEFWMNRTDKLDDYRFVYMGPKGSWTPLHTDVFDSYSWSANICGSKKWILFPPDEFDNLRDIFGKLPFDVQSPEMNDETIYPNYKKIKTKIEFIQRAGEVIFVPSRWSHQVHNLEDSISVNHNWFNAFNVDVIWESMKNELVEVQKEVEDCKDMDGWDDQCQIILKSTFGMDFNEFSRLLRSIALSRLPLVRKCMNKMQSPEWINRADIIKDHQGRNAIEYAMAVFDLTTIERTLKNVYKTSLNETEVCSEFMDELAEALGDCKEIANTILDFDSGNSI